MRIMILALSATALLFPAFAVADPVPTPAAAPSTTTSTAPQAPTAEQAPAASSAPAVSPVPAAQSSPATTAATQTGPESVVVRADRVDLDQVVCKDGPPSIGSRLGSGRQCLTQREWNRRMHESQDITRRDQVVGFHN